MAKDHDKETIHPPPHNKGDNRSAVKAQTEEQSDTLRIGFDYERYAHFLEDADLTEDQKQELLGALWRILSEFVMLGFGVHPIQQACGQSEYSNSEIDLASSFLIQSDLKHLIEEFDDVADGSAPDAREGVDA